MTDLILISDGEEEEEEVVVTPPPSASKNARKISNPTVLNLDSDPPPPPGSACTPFLVDDDEEIPISHDASLDFSGARVSSRRDDKFSGKRVISLESDSEDNSHRPETSNKHEPIHCGVEFGNSDTDSDNSTDWLQGASFQYSLLNKSVKVGSDQGKEEKSSEKMGRRKQTEDPKCTSLSVDALPTKQVSKDGKRRASEEKKLRKEQDKLQKAVSKAEYAEHKKLEREKKKWEKGKARKSIIAVIDNKLAEGSLGASLISGLSEKGITYRVTPNPIEKSIVWTITVPEDIAQTLPLGPKIPYVLLVYEAEDFCNLVANERLLENVSRVRDQYPSYTVCYLTNQLMSYIKKRLVFEMCNFCCINVSQKLKKQYSREGVAYKNPGNHDAWRRPPIDEVLANLTTHYTGVHSRHCVDKAEVSEHVVGLTSNLAYCKFRKKLTRLSVNADSALLSKDAAAKHLIKKSLWLKALVSIPKVQPRHAVAVSKKYPSMRSLLKVYMDPNISIHDKEFLLKDLRVEGIVSGEQRLGEVCSKRIYRVLMSPCGSIKTDDVENGAASFTIDLNLNPLL
ncbi:unnamed protein product [Cochlearia groenlandica]